MMAGMSSTRSTQADESGTSSPRQRARRHAAWALLGLVAASAALIWEGSKRSGRIDGDLSAIREAIERKQYAEAQAALTRRLARLPEDGSAWLMLGGVLGVQGRDPEAEAAFDRVRLPEAAWVQARTLTAEILIRRRDARGAERVLREVADRVPSAVDARRRLAYLLALGMRNEEARAVLWELYKLSPDPRHLVTLVGLSSRETDNRDAKPELGEFLRASPDDPLLRRARGLLLLKGGRPLEASADLEASARAIEDDPEGRIALAECRLAANDLAGAESTLGAEPGRKTWKARWWLIRGRLAEDGGKPEAAVAAYRKGLEVDGDDHSILYRLGQALVRRGEAEAARPLLERAEAIRVRWVTLVLELDRCVRGGRDPDLFEGVARICHEVGLEAESRAWYEQVTQLDPTRLSAQGALSKPFDPPAVDPPHLKLKSVATAAPKASGPATVAKGSEPRFEEVAARSGIDFRYDSGATPEMYLGDTMGGGVALIDFDEDGWLDVYLVNGCPMPFDPAHPPTPNRLYRNKRDGTFEDATGRAGVAGSGYGMGATVADYDGDGHDDLFVTGIGRTILYRNRGDGTFQDVTERAGVRSGRWSTASGFGDLDGDGDLDLMVVTYVEADPRACPECLDPTGRRIHCPPGHFPAQFDQLFRNNGDGTFADVSKEAGIEVPMGLGLGLAVVDLDDDGKLDLFVANDAVPNHAFRNLGGWKFEEVGGTSGLAYDGDGKATASMGVVAEDLDGDRLVDIFHTNFINEPNTLHHNLGGGLFSDSTLASGLDAPSRPVTGFGTVAFDIENDGVLDLFVANGHVDDSPLAGHPMPQLPHLYRARAPGQFDLAPRSTAPYFGRPTVGRGVAAGDLDNDGRVDLVVVHRDAPVALLRNATEGGHWLGLRLVGDRSGRTPVGARVTCRVGPTTAVRWLTSGTSYLASSEQAIRFGLGAARVVDHLEVRWPSGLTQRWDDVPADRLLEVREGRDPEPARIAPR